MIGLLRRHRTLRLLWTGETTSQIGNSVTTVVIPLIAVTTLHTSAFTVSLIKAAAWLPWLAIGLLVGAWIDQLRDRRWLMIACDFVAAASFATVPLAWATGSLTAVQLLLVALVAGTASVFFSTAYTVFLLDVIDEPEDRAAGNGALQGSASAANVGGPGLGGLLVTLVGGPVTLLLDSLSFLFSAACLTAIRPRAHAPRPRPPTASLRERTREGLSYVRRDPLLRAMTLFGGSANLGLMGYQSILVVFLVRETHLQAGQVGLVLGLSGLGGVTGAFFVAPLTRRLGTARAMLVTKIVGGASTMLVPLATSPGRAGFVVASGVLVGAGIIAGNVIATTFMQGYVPPEVYARTSATNNVINLGTMPLGAVLGGALSAWLGLDGALWITTAIVPLSTVFLLTSPLRRMRDLPQRELDRQSDCSTAIRTSSTSGPSSPHHSRQSRSVPGRAQVGLRD
jgi:MFS family permease